MKKLLTITLLLCTVQGMSQVKDHADTSLAYRNKLSKDLRVQFDNAPLKYQLSKHGQYKEGSTEYTSVFQVGDTVTTRYGFDITIKMIRWRNKKVRFEYFGGNGWFLEGDLRRK